MIFYISNHILMIFNQVIPWTENQFIAKIQNENWKMIHNDSV